MALLRFDVSLINQLLLTIYPLGHFSIALLEWGLIRWGTYLWRKSSGLALIILPLLLASLSYDNCVLAFGNLMGEGELLENLSRLRFLLHSAVVPLFIVIGIELAHRAGAAWATTIVRALSWLIALGLAGIDITTNYAGLELVPVYFAGILRYIPANSSPPVITIVVNVFMLLIGLGVWIRMKWSYLFFGTLVALLGNAIPASKVGTLPGSASEFVMALSLLLTEQRMQFVHSQSTQTQKQEDGLMVDSATSGTTFEWEYVIRKDRYTIYQTGSHIQGNFIQAFVPHSPYRDQQGKARLITYLHGFALCMPKFYEDHLEELAKQGYYVFFPDFQKSRYPDDPKAGKTLQANEEEAPLSFWLKVLTDTVSKRDKFDIKDTVDQSQERRKQFSPPVPKLVTPTLFEYLRIALALVVFILVVRLFFSWFNRRYGKNLIHLISTVGLSLLYSPMEWIDQAVDITDMAWQKLCQDHSAIAQTEFDFYVFGHSLGGLLALSWPLYVAEGQQKFLPKQIITADPAPSTEMGIPQIALWILKLFNSPFAKTPINIRKIGQQLTLPLGIMHGVDDKIVRPQSWVKRSFWQDKSNFDCIASEEKKIYFSLSNTEHQPPLVAFHNQAVTDTTYFDDDLFDFFGGVKKHPNLYNWKYIWYGMDLVLTHQANVNQLLDQFTVPGYPIVITDTLPEKPFSWTKIAIALLVGLALWALGYWLWHAFMTV